MLSTQEVHLDMSALAGPLLLGYMFNWGLFGALSVQTYFYHVTFRKDRKLVKFIVCVVYAVELTQTVIISRDAFATFARGFGDDAQLNSPQLEWFATPIISGMVSCIVQMFYSHRVYIFSRSKILTATIIVIALLQCCAAIYEGTQARITDYTDLALSRRVYVSCTIWLGGSAACDVLIAGSMTYLLVHHDTGLRKTHIVIRKLVRLVMETGTLTATMAVLALTVFLCFPGKTYHACIALMLAKLYSNSLLALLNSRARLKAILDADEPIQSLFPNLPTSGETPSNGLTGPIVFGDVHPSVISVQGHLWIGTNSAETGTMKEHELVEEL